MGRLLERLAGVKGEGGKELRAQYERLMAASDLIAGTLGPLGWIFFESAPVEEYVTAATLVEQGKPDEAEQLLVEFWDNDARWQDWPTHRLVGLYGADDYELVAVREGRDRLLRKALDYEAKVLLLELGGYQPFFFGRKGRYAASRRELASLGFTLRVPDFEIVVEPDGREYRAWVETPGEYLLAIAGRDGEQVANVYEGEEPPRGGLDSGVGWRNFREDLALPNW